MLNCKVGRGVWSKINMEAGTRVLVRNGARTGNTDKQLAPLHSVWYVPHCVLSPGVTRYVPSLLLAAPSSRSVDISSGAAYSTVLILDNIILLTVNDVEILLRWDLTRAAGLLSVKRGLALTLPP